jgi:hypothetical protein
MMNEFTILASLLGRLATALGHHSCKELCEVGVARAIPARWQEVDQTWMVNGHCKDR